MTLNEKAADWWAKQLLLEDKSEQFRAELLARLDANPDWKELYVDYDPSEGPLLEATQTVTNCTGSLFSAREIFDPKTYMRKKDQTLLVREGRGPYMDIDAKRCWHCRGIGLVYASVFAVTATGICLHCHGTGREDGRKGEPYTQVVREWLTYLYADIDSEP